jgi:hypothetical protein
MFPCTLKESNNMIDSRYKLCFKDEPRKLKLGNLPTHTREHAGLIERREADRNAVQGKSSEAGGLTPTKSSQTGFTLAGAKLMEKYVQDGLLNPQVEPTQSRFT